MRSGRVRRRGAADILSYLLLLVLVVMCVVPFYSMFVSATHENAVVNSSIPLLPGASLLENYQRMSNGVNVWRGLGNSVLIAVTTTLLSSYVAGITAYGFSVYRFRGRSLLFGVILCTMMVPSQLGIIGQFQLMSDLRLLDNLWALILPGVANAGAVFFVRQYTDAYFPRPLLEIGRIDGCGEIRMYHQIVLPIIVPAIATQAIFMFITSWNSFLQPLILMFSQTNFPMPVLIQQMQGLHSDYAVLYLGVSISVLPILIVFFVCSRWIVDGLSVGSVKG